MLFAIDHSFSHVSLTFARVSVATSTIDTPIRSPAATENECVVSEQVVPVPIVQVTVCPAPPLVMVTTPDPAANPAVPAFTLRLRIVPAEGIGTVRLEVVSVQAIIEPPAPNGKMVTLDVAVPEHCATKVPGRVMDKLPAPSEVMTPCAS